jgi:hypothetical protein
MVFTNPTLKVAATQAGLTAGNAYQCQVTSAVISTTAAFNTIPATGCAGASQSPGAPAFQLDIAWLQDWTASPGGGLSGWAWTNKGLAMWVEIVPDPTGAPTVKAQAQCWIVAGQFGGTFGDGSAGPANATWPCLNAPTITPATLLADEAAADEAAADEQLAEQPA